MCFIYYPLWQALQPEISSVPKAGMSASIYQCSSIVIKHLNNIYKESNIWISIPCKSKHHLKFIPSLPAKAFNPKLKRLLLINKPKPTYQTGDSSLCLHLNIHELALVYQQTFHISNARRRKGSNKNLWPLFPVFLYLTISDNKTPVILRYILY